MDGKMEVEEIFKKIMKEKKWEKKQLAAVAGVLPSTLSSKLGTHWNAHWRAFFRLLPIMAELDIIKERDLHTPTPHEPKPDPGGPKTGKAETDQGRKAGPGKGRT